MASPVSYTRATQVAIAAVAVDLCFNQGQIVSGIALGVIANSAIEFLTRNAAKIKNFKERVEAQLNNYKNNFNDFSEFSKHRIVTFNQDYSNPKLNQHALCSAIARIQHDFPEAYHHVLEHENLSSQEQILNFFTNELSPGCCSGYANVLFDKIIRGQSNSLQKSTELLQRVDIFYFQIVDRLYDIIPQKVSSNYKNKLNAKVEKEMSKQCLGQKVTFDFSSVGNEREKVKKLIEEDSDKILENLNRKYHYNTFSTIGNFRITVTPDVYRRILENTIRKLFKNKKDFVGVLQIPKHVISFQFGPKGYFIHDAYDAIGGGLFTYRTPEKFFQELHLHALYDVRNLDDSYFAKNDLNDIRCHFKIFPLNNLR